jgi:hypothetical protein
MAQIAHEQWIKCGLCHYRDVGEEMSDIFKSLQELDNSRKDTGLSLQTEKNFIKNEMQMVRVNLTWRQSLCKWKH